MKTRTLLQIFLLSIPLAGCVGTMGGFGGTDHGNPDSKTSSEIASSLARASCDTINFCTSGFDRWDCIRKSPGVPGVASKLGLKSNGSLQDIDSALSDDTAAVNTEELQKCMNHIEAIRCNELAPVERIWSINEPTNYSGLSRFWSAVSSACGKVVSPKN